MKITVIGGGNGAIQQQTKSGLLEVEHFRFCSQIYQMWPTIQNHVREEFCLVNLTSIGTRNSDPDWHLIFN